MLKNNTLAIALAALLVGGVATAAFMNNRGKADVAADVQPSPSLAADPAAADGDQPIDEAGLPASAKVDYADVVNVEPIKKSEKLYAHGDRHRADTRNQHHLDAA